MICTTSFEEAKLLKDIADEEVKRRNDSVQYYWGDEPTESPLRTDDDKEDEIEKE